MNRLLRRASLALVTVAVGLLALAAAAQASTVSLKCGGPGKRNKDSAGTVLCAAKPGQPRNLEGVLRDDKNKPVGGKLKVTFSDWVPQGNGSFAIDPSKEVTISANAAGKFTIPVKTATRVSIAVEALGDEKLGISPASAAAEVSRELQVKVAKLGGGRVRISVKGTSAPLQIAVTDEEGYEVSGGKIRKANHGVAVFNLGSQRGSFGIYVDAGELSDLFWESGRPSFRL